MVENIPVKALTLFSVLSTMFHPEYLIGNLGKICIVAHRKNHANFAWYAKIAYDNSCQKILDFSINFMYNSYRTS